MQKPPTCALERKLGCIDWDIWNYSILFHYNKHGCFSELRDFLKFLWKSNRFAPSRHQVANSSTKIGKICNALVAKPRKSAATLSLQDRADAGALKHSHRKNAPIYTLQANAIA